MDPEKEFEKFKTEWPLSAVIQATKNCKPHELGEIIYDEQCKYVGPDHKKYCGKILGHWIKHIILALDEV